MLTHCFVKCSSIVEQLVSDHIQAQLETIHRAHKQSHQKCPQHPSQSHTLVREAGKDCFGRVIKPPSEMNAMLYTCTLCSRKFGAGRWTQHLAQCMGIGVRRRNKLIPTPTTLYFPFILCFFTTIKWPCANAQEWRNKLIKFARKLQRVFFLPFSFPPRRIAPCLPRRLHAHAHRLDV